MSNKSTGTAFEREFAQTLSENGFWAHCLKDNSNGQPFDVIAARNGATFVFDCKDCQGEAFRLSRIEENQHNAMTLWRDTGNRQGMFAIRIQGIVILVSHLMIALLKENGTKQIKDVELLQHGIRFEHWIEHENKLDKQVTRCR